MQIDKAIEILEKWQAGGFATRIDDLNPALSLGIEALKSHKIMRQIYASSYAPLLPSETEG